MPLVSSQPCFVPLTSDNEGWRDRHGAPFTSFMALSERDSRAVRLVGTFQQADASQLKEAVFHDVSDERARQLLIRLKDQRYLRRLSRRPAGEKGGSGPYVYQLGPAGWWLCGKRGDYSPRTAIAEHELAVFDLYLDVVRAQRAGQLVLMEADGCQLEVWYGKARADMALHIGVPALNKRRRFCVEAEVTDKRPSYIKAKCDDYVAQMKNQDGGMLPRVLFVAPHEWIKARIRRTLNTVHAEYRDLFTVCTFEEFAALLIAP